MRMNEIVLSVEDNLAGQRLDKVIVSLCPQFSRSHIQKMLEDGAISVNGASALKGYKTNAGDVIRIAPPKPRKLEAEAENIPLDIVYEDDDLLVVNKPRGMVVHPAVGNYNGTLVNALIYHCGDSLSGINGVIRPGIVHRIDKDTSGLLIVAKNDFAHERLAAQIKDHNFKREYRAVVHGRMKDVQGTVNAPIGRNPNDRKKMCVIHQNSRNAVTHYEVLDSTEKFSYLRVTLETGRTHQIRVHMAYIGHPIAGDTVYGPKNGVKSLNGQCLHAGVIGFVHPRSGEYMEFEAPLPEYFINFLKQQRFMI